MIENKTPGAPPAPPEQVDSGETSQPKTPATERGTNGSDVSERMRDVHAALAQQPARDPATQRFIGSNVAAGTTLERSAAFWRAVEPAKRELVAHVRTDLALDADAAETLRGLVDGYAEVRLFRTSMFLRLVDQGGPITTKGKARALYRAYLDALDRETKLAQVLGLERKTKPVNPLDAVRAAVVEANR